MPEAALFKLPSGRMVTREEAERFIALKQEEHRRREAKRLEVEREAIIARCSTLLGFIMEFWYVLEPVRQFKTGLPINAMCQCLEAVTAGRILRLLITVPPGMMKSLILVFWTAWEWGPMGLSHLQVLATSYSQQNVLRDNIKLRRLVESEKFQALWPLELRSDQNSKGKFETTAGGFSEARPFGSTTGGRGDRVKVDDPHSTETAESDAERATTTRIFREGITDRLNDVATSAMVIIMQRLHAQDVAAVALELDIGFVHLNLPMEFEPANDNGDGRISGGPCRIWLDGELFFEDPRTEAGELLFPERFPGDGVDKLKKAKGTYAWAGQYQQRPVPRDGGLFKRHWFGFVSAIPNGPRKRVRAWDQAATKKITSNDPDWTVGLKMSWGDFLLIEHVERFRDTAGQVAKTIRRVAESDGIEVTVRLTQDPGSAGKALADTQVTKLLTGFNVVSKTATGDKATRAAPAAVQAEAGNIFILRTGDPDRDAWIEPFLAEVCLFPAGAHDDQVDAFADAVNELALGDTFDINEYLRAYG